MDKKGKVIVVNIRKGGTGKSTTVINLAAEAAKRGQKVLIIDGDANKTCVDFCSNRNIENESRAQNGVQELPFIKAEYHDPGIGIRPIVVEMKKDYDLIFVDTAGGDSKLFLSVIQLADTILIPLQTDLKAMKQLSPTLAVINDVQEKIQVNDGWEDYVVPVKILFNQAKAGTKAFRSAIDMAKEYRDSLPFCKTVVPDIQEHRSFDPHLTGQALTDIKHPKRAVYQLLLDEILEGIDG